MEHVAAPSATRDGDEFELALNFAHESNLMTQERSRSGLVWPIHGITNFVGTCQHP
jgi:hypothetical protein